MTGFVKRREPAEPGSIPDVLGMFHAEVRFYREIAPHVGIRVPACHQAEIRPDGSTLLVLEDLSDWAPDAEPVAAAIMLRQLHERWSGRAVERWPWLRPVGAADDLVGALYDRVWAGMRDRRDLSSRVRTLGDRLVGRVPEAEAAAGRVGPMTLIHGDAATRNFRTGPDGPALLDWEDVSAAPGIGDIAWLLVASTPVERWDDVLDAYGTSGGLEVSLPPIAVQGLLSLDDYDEGTDEAIGRSARLDEAARRLGI